MKYLCMALIRFYRRFLSPLKGAPTCRFTPSCSAYALEAYEKRGFFAGFVLSLWRILRCSPFSPGGPDPVPERGFRTMPMRFSKYDRYRAEHPELYESERDIASDAEEADPATDLHPNDSAGTES